MKTIWNVVAFLAVVHLFGGLGFAGWLAVTGRLDRERVDAIRAVLVDGPTDESAPAAPVPASYVTEPTPDAPTDDLPDGTSSAERIRAMEQSADRQRLEREALEREARRRAEQLSLALLRIETREAEFEQRRAAFEAVIAADIARRSEEGFRNAVRTLQSLAGREAADILRIKVANGDRDTAVEFLAAMDERSRRKTMREFEGTLANDLLEGLERHGADFVREAARDVGLFGSGSYVQPGSSTP